jgi:RNA polymerase sigma factor (TIGR02999 family)
VAAPASSEVTLVLRRLGSAADESDRSAAASRLLELLYGELRRIAARLMRRERAGQTLQPTALVHEVYMRLVDQPGMQWSDRAHFLGVAARAMRQILVDRARRRTARRRGGGLHRVTLDEEAAGDGGRELELLELHEAMERLASLDERAARVTEMRLFGGMTVAEIAHVLGVSTRTVDDDWAVAKAWLRRELAGEAAP